MSTPETVIDLRLSTDYEASMYDIIYRSAAVHRIRKARHNPGASFLVTVWNNANRPNPHPGEVRWNSVGSIGGDGQYLDPNNRGTDETISVTTAAQAVVITSSPMKRDPEGETLEVGQTVWLRLPEGGVLGPFIIAQRALHDPHLEPVSE